ncbi:MAG TPA: ATP synthase F1 subunit gamma [Elusimicrobiota bacterium]|nr:ATP synthase F1 subunit gamma [Elusimicrobiota bacterium]
MASLREIRRKIKSVKSTEQITRAMKMVAAARMRRAQSSILSARPFARGMEDLAWTLSGGEDRALLRSHPFFRKPASGAPLLILVTADKGLCGSFNSNLFKAALEWLRRRPGKARVAVAGKKGRDFLHRLRGQDVEVTAELAGIFPKVHFSHAEILGDSVIADFEAGRASEVSVLYNEFKSVAQQKLSLKTLLPILPGPDFAGNASSEREFEPGRERLLDALLRRFVKAEIYRVLLESQAAELAARMNAMDAAAKNASELKADLNLDLNRQRQALITKEIAELVGGAEALAS